MTTPRLVTIGVYGFEEEEFFQALRSAGVELFCDIRQRRGVRGSRYAFANSQRLQSRLAEIGIRYLHVKELAPAKDLRQTQYAADKSQKTAKRQRTQLEVQISSIIESHTRLLEIEKDGMKAMDEEDSKLKLLKKKEN